MFLFQDMLKKRQEVERLAASGKHKYEYDSDEDTAEGTWEHKYVKLFFFKYSILEHTSLQVGRGRTRKTLCRSDFRFILL